MKKWLVWIVPGIVGLLMAWLTSPASIAQQPPYAAYRVTGGCLYITAQGHATVITETQMLAAQRSLEGGCK